MSEGSAKTGRLFGIYGAAGAGRGAMPLLRAQVGSAKLNQCVFVDDHPTVAVVNSSPCLTFEEFIAAPAAEKSVAIAVADSSVRERLAEKCSAAGIQFETIVAAEHVRMYDVEIGEGAILSPFTVVTSNVRIGRHFHCNIHSIVEHDCRIGDFVTFAPGVRCNGNVHIEDHVYIGAGAIIRQGTPQKPLLIGRGAIVGMGAVVLNDVLPGATVVGNPARALKS